jgi:hypothetical protein
VTPRFGSRRPLVLAVAGAAIAGGVAIGTTHASAATTQCAIRGTAHISPGLKTTAHAFTDTFDGSFSGCAGGGVKSAVVHETGSGTGSCSTSSTVGRVSIRWNNGKTSTVAISTKSAGSELRVAGKVTSGLFAGSNATALLSFVVNPALCATSGASTLSFDGAGTI